MIESTKRERFDDRLINQQEPEGDNDQGRLRKQQEVMNRVLANSLVSQLLRSGCDTGQIVDFATQILHHVTQNGFANCKEPGNSPEPNNVIEIPWKLEQKKFSSGKGPAITIHGKRVTLRSVQKADLPLLASWRKDSRIQQTCSHERLRELIQTFPATNSDRNDFIICEESDSPIGLVSLFNRCKTVQQAEIAKLIGNPDALGVGYAREASCLILAFAFEHLGLERVYLRTNGFNLKNIKLNERLGFKFEGILRASYRLNDDLIDVVLMSMLSTEFRQNYRLLTMMAKTT